MAVWLASKLRLLLEWLTLPLLLTAMQLPQVSSESWRTSLQDCALACSCQILKAEQGATGHFHDVSERFNHGLRAAHSGAVRRARSYIGSHPAALRWGSISCCVRPPCAQLCICPHASRYPHHSAIPLSSSQRS